MKYILKTGASVQYGRNRSKAKNACGSRRKRNSKDIKRAAEHAPNVKLWPLNIMRQECIGHDGGKGIKIRRYSRRKMFESVLSNTAILGSALVVETILRDSKDKVHSTAFANEEKIMIEEQSNYNESISSLSESDIISIEKVADTNNPQRKEVSDEPLPSKEPSSSPSNDVIGSEVNVKVLQRNEELNRRMLSINNAPEEFPTFVRTQYDVTLKGIEKYSKNKDGLYYLDTVLGNGAFPTSTSEVIFHYTAYNENGGRIDSSYRQGAPVRGRMGINAMIPGFEQGIR